MAGWPQLQMEFPYEIWPKCLINPAERPHHHRGTQSRQKFGIKDIGNVHVPMKELLDSFGESKDKKCFEL